MTDLLVDTNVVSFIFKNDSRAQLYANDIAGNRLHLSFVTIAELYRWAVKNKWGQPRIDALRQAIGKYAILAPDEQTAWHWARLMCLPGQPIAPGDAWIAAAALRYGMPLVTHNGKHFDHIPGLVLISHG